jgi:hypothetical protein
MYSNITSKKIVVRLLDLTTSLSKYLATTSSSLRYTNWLEPTLDPNGVFETPGNQGLVFGPSMDPKR